MRVSFCCPGLEDTAPWLQGLNEALGEPCTTLWQPGDPCADFAVAWGPPQQFLDEQRHVRALFAMGAGVDGFMRLQIPEDLRLIRVEDAGMSAQMAEYVCHAFIRHFRELDVYEADANKGIWAYRKPRVRSQFPIGVMGLGVLGRRVAQALASFDFPVNGWSRTLKSVSGIRCFGGDAGLAQFLAESRGLVCLLPLTAATRNILNHTTLSQLQRGGYVVNVARGAHVVDEDLIALADSGHLAGATLDVFRTEPLPPEHAFWQHPRIVVTPHMSARTLHEESIAQIAGKIIAMNQGQAVSGVVNREAGY